MIKTVCFIGRCGIGERRSVALFYISTKSELRNGKNFTIKNLNLAPKADSDKYFCGGLFGYTYGAATIKNLVLENITVTSIPL